LYQAIEIKEKAKPELSLVTIKAGSEYLIKGLTEGVLLWRNNEYTSEEMKKVINCDLFKIADHLIEELNDMGVM
jgi:ribonuclease HI